MVLSSNLFMFFVLFLITLILQSCLQMQNIIFGSYSLISNMLKFCLNLKLFILLYGVVQFFFQLFLFVGLFLFVLIHLVTIKWCIHLLLILIRSLSCLLIHQELIIIYLDLQSIFSFLYLLLASNLIDVVHLFTNYILRFISKLLSNPLSFLLFLEVVQIFLF